MRVVIFPLYESIGGYLKDRDIAWFLHPLLSFLTVVVYSLVFIRFKIWQYDNYVIKYKHYGKE